MDGQSVEVTQPEINTNSQEVSPVITQEKIGILSKFVSAVRRKFGGGNTEIKPENPQITLEQKKQDAENLEKILNSPAGKDFRSSTTDDADRQRLQLLRTEISQAEPQSINVQSEYPQPTLEPVPGIPNIENYPKPMVPSSTPEEQKAA